LPQYTFRTDRQTDNSVRITAYAVLIAIHAVNNCGCDGYGFRLTEKFQVVFTSQ